MKFSKRTWEADDNSMQSIMKYAENVSGFLEKEEGIALYSLAKKASKLGPCLEIGSYCGKSAIYIGSACKEESNLLYSIDHHQGSEEHQPGQEYFDPSLLDQETSKINTSKIFIKNIKKAGLEYYVVPIIETSEIAAKEWNTPLGMVFIDGSHNYESVFNDFICWYKHILPTGYLIFHDVFENPNSGGQGPYRTYKTAIASGIFKKHKIVRTLGILKRKKQI